MELSTGKTLKKISNELTESNPDIAVLSSKVFRMKFDRKDSEQQLIVEESNKSSPTKTLKRQKNRSRMSNNTSRTHLINFREESVKDMLA